MPYSPIAHLELGIILARLMMPQIAAVKIDEVSPFAGEEGGVLLLCSEPSSFLLFPYPADSELHWAAILARMLNLVFIERVVSHQHVQRAFTV